MRRFARTCIHLAIAVSAAVATIASAAPWSSIGRAPTAAELKAWDIDVRGDFQGLPPGSGSVDAGAEIWVGKCASCHGDFGESNQVFTPIVGGTTRADIEAGRVASLSSTPGYPHRTTLMKISKLSSIWDYIRRAMPWNAPKSLTDDEVYAVVAYILNLGDIVPADFVLSDRNIAEVQKRLPNRDGHVRYEPMWDTRGPGDTHNTACMRDCETDPKVTSSIPLAAIDANGNIAEQVRPFGPARGTDTATLARTAGDRSVALAPTPAVAPAADGAVLARNAGCTGCHGMAQKIVGPGFQDVAKRYAGRPDAAEHLAGKIRSGSQGVWGPVPMPAQQQVGDADVRAIAQWLAAGAKP